MILSLLCVANATLYHVIPDDDHYFINNNSFTLHHYLNNANKYFTSDNHLQFSPGQYNPTGNILIENVKNFLLTGSRANEVINTVITCTGPSGVAVINNDDITIAKYYLNPAMSRLSLLLHESKWRTSVNNSDNLRVQWDLSGFYPILLMCTTMASVHRLPLFFEVICNLL